MSHLDPTNLQIVYPPLTLTVLPLEVEDKHLLSFRAEVTCEISFMHEKYSYNSSNLWFFGDSYGQFEKQIVELFQGEADQAKFYSMGDERFSLIISQKNKALELQLSMDRPGRGSDRLLFTWNHLVDRQFIEYLLLRLRSRP